MPDGRAIEKAVLMIAPEAFCYGQVRDMDEMEGVEADPPVWNGPG
jgi:hypothetical protein